MLFGTKIDGTTLSNMPGYDTDPTKNTPEQCAEVALSCLNNFQKDADSNINAMKERYGNGVCTEVMIYNATGYDMQFSSNSDVHGDVYGEWPIDPIVANGQWCVFLHVHPSGQAVGSEGSVTFTVNFLQVTMNWMTSWSAATGGKNVYSVSPGDRGTATGGNGTTQKVTYLIQ